MKSLVKLAVIVLVAVVFLVLIFVANQAAHAFDFCGKECIEYIYVRFLALFVILMISCLVLRFSQGLLTLVIIFFSVTLFFGVYLLVTAPPVPPPPIDPKYDTRPENSVGCRDDICRSQVVDSEEGQIGMVDIEEK